MVKRDAARSGALAMVLESQQAQRSADPDAPQPWETGTQPVGSPSGAAPHRGTVVYPAKGRAKIPPEACRPWALADRPDNEFDGLDELADSILKDGQLQPAVVRPVSDPKAPAIRYEIIFGRKRWMATQKAGVLLDVDVRQLDDEAAFRAMVGENSFRSGLSDYAKSLSYASAIERGVYPSGAQMAQKLRISPTLMSMHLAFARLDRAVVTKFHDIRKIPVRLGYELHRAIAEGYQAQVLRDLSRIESGEILRTDIPRVWQEPGLGMQGTSDDEREKGGSSSSPGLKPALAVGMRAEYKGSGGRTLFTLAPSARGSAVTIPTAVANRLPEEFWAELATLMESRLAESRPATN
jgi:ParB/RepB/Spo0J family partition protein